MLLPNLWFTKTKTMVFSDQTYGFLQPNLWFTPTKPMVLLCEYVKIFGV